MSSVASWESRVEIKNKFQGIPSTSAAQSAQATQTAPVDLSGVPEISLADVNACLRRSKQAAAVHEDILQRAAGNGVQLSKSDIEGMLTRAGVEKTDVKTVLAYHCKHSHRAFDQSALKFMATLDWSDVSAAHVEELKRQNKEQVESHRQFITDDKREFDQLRKDDAQALQKKAAEQQKLKSKTAFEADADFADEITKSGITDPKQAALLALHRKRFTNN